MKKEIIGAAALMLLVGIVGCKSVAINCSPSGATFRCDGETLSDSNPEVKVNIFKAKDVSISKPGYASKKVTVTFDSPNKINVSLDRLYNIKSTPSGADVYVNGNMVGTTPAESIAIGTGGNVFVRKKGWVDSSKLQIKKDTPVDITLTMDQDGPGRRLLDLIPTSDGITVNIESIFSDTDIGEHSPNVASCKKLTNQPENEYILSFSLLPDGKTLVTSILEEYTKNDKTDYRANIWQLNTSVAGAPRKAVTQGGFFDIHPNPSVDGETLYFSTNRNGRLGIWNLNMNGKGGLRTVTAGNTADCSPALKPETDHLFYTAVLPDESASAYIWERPLDGGMPEQLTEGYDSQWSPDGTKLLYIKGSLKDNKARIRVCDPDGNNAVQISPDDGEFNDVDARWSPDGKKIVFASDRSNLKGERNFDIYIMDADGGNLTQLTSNASRDDKPVFAPDGKTVFFRSNRGLAWDIWALEIKTGGQ